MSRAPDLPERLFERAGPLLDRLRTEAPTHATVLRKAREILESMNDAEQVAVINAHPRIGERPDRLSPASLNEQRFGRDLPSAEVLRQLAALNDAYERKFGFRFVIFVNRRTHDAIVPILEARLVSTRDEERRTALREILAIAADRLKREES